MKLSQEQITNAAQRSRAANQTRRAREPIHINWDDALARLHDVLDELYGCDR